MSVIHELDMGGEHQQPVPVQILGTDESLTYHYGHLSPEQIALSALEKHDMARVAQLKMIEAHSLETYNHDAYCAWLGVYNTAIGPFDGNSV